MEIANHPERADLLAAAYALGTLRGRARRRFEAIARKSPTLKGRVVVWQERIAAMAELEPARTPSPIVWERIEKQIRNLEAAAPSQAVPPPVPDALQGLARLWRVAALGGAFAALAAAAVALNLQNEVGQQRQQLARVQQERQSLAQEAASLRQAPGRFEYVAVLVDEGQSRTVLVTFDTQRQVLTLKQETPLQPGGAQSLQLWALPPGGPPRSLGVLQAERVERLAAAAEQVRGVPALAISLEPRGGAPAGSGPTGPVLVKGALIQAPL